MLFHTLLERSTRPDPRDDCDGRTRHKHRPGRRWPLGLTLLVCLLLAAGLGTVSARVRAQPGQPIEAAPVLPAPIRLQAPDDLAASREIQQLKSLASATARGEPGATKSPLPRTATPATNASRAAWLLGLIYLHGSGVARDPIQAALWFERARVLGEPLASAGLAWCEIEGCKGSPNPSGAGPWIAQLRNVKPARADYLEWVVESRLSPLQLAVPPSGPTDPDAGSALRELLLRSAQRGDANARIELGLQSVAAGNLAQAQAYFKAAAPKSAAASTNLALLSEQLKTAALAAPASMSAADLLASAQRFHRGEGRPANYAEAIRLYQLAASKGSEEARRMLALIFSRLTPTGELDVQWMQELSQLDLSKGLPRLNTTGTKMLQREPTPLFDFLPEAWRKRTPSVNR
jgi:uncharacterized protein